MLNTHINNINPTLLELDAEFIFKSKQIDRISPNLKNITDNLIIQAGSFAIINGTISGNLYPTDNTYNIGSKDRPYLSSEITTENTKKINIWNIEHTYNTSITSNNIEDINITLPQSAGNSNSILLNDGNGGTIWTTNYLPITGDGISGDAMMNTITKLMERIDKMDTEITDLKYIIYSLTGR